jgi:hypothetical protein
LHPKPTELFAEKAQLTMVMQSRSINSLAELDIINDGDGGYGDIMKLLSQLSYLCGLAKNHPLNEFVALRSMRLTMQHGLSMHLALILTNYSIPLRIGGRRIRAACKYSTLVERIFERFAKVGEFGPRRNSDFLLAEFILHAGILPLTQSYGNSLETFLNITHLALAQGKTETAFISAMLFPLSYFASGIPLSSLLEPKLALFERKAEELNSSFAPIFHCSRQVLLSLQGKRKGKVGGPELDVNPTSIDGEEDILDKLEGTVRSMTLRDFSIYRLFLSCIFGDEECMQTMMERLKSYSYFDLPLARQYLRLTFGGIAAFWLARSTGQKEYRKTGRGILKELQKLDISDDSKAGNVNVRPVILCITAVDRHKLDDYTRAIECCREHRLVHFEGLMSELCGLYCLDSLAECSQQELAQGFLGNAMWCYSDWGAYGKVEAMKRQYEFLSTWTRRRTANVQRSSDTRRSSSSIKILSSALRRTSRRRSSNGSSSNSISSLETGTTSSYCNNQLT